LGFTGIVQEPDSSPLGRKACPLCIQRNKASYFKDQNHVGEVH